MGRKEGGGAVPLSGGAGSSSNKMSPGLTSISLVLGPGHTMLDGDAAQLLPKGARPIFSAHVCCDQTAGWIKMQLGTKIGFGPGDIVLHGNPAAPKRGTAPPPFGLCLLWPNGWMDKGATWYGGRPQPRPRCVRRGPSCPTPKAAQLAALLFSAHVYCGQTVAHLRYC